MHGDYTRMTFRPRKDPAGVLMQQGRVTLDADWNELVELVDRRFRAETVDALGRCYVSKETPNAFAIALSSGALTIGGGRAYVDGLLAENHGADPAEYDPVLGEVRGTAPLKYEDQPYLPDAGAIAPLPTGGTHVVYLDAWEREVTYLQDPNLVEKAIAVDTATRLQNAWQVRVLEAPEGTTCSSDLPAWDALTAPSAGRLTTNAVGVPASTDPCTIPATGGYRGTENRLYRVEIQGAGTLGAATFKWSRDNASIGGRVEAIDNATRKVVTLDRLGRDGVRRIRVDDWVEVTDDVRELYGVAGELRKVVGIDEVAETITLATALPSGAFDPTDADRHTRVVRWDQRGADVDAANGVVAVPATAGSAIVLEDGVQIAFDVDPTVGDFHVDDYWVFAARTADASVEELVDEPPRGIKHHFCRLAVVTFPGTVVDCRTPPAEEDHGCDCTLCVTPESHSSGELTIQKAVDTVGPVGGKVCLQVGLYPLDEPVRIRAARSLQLEGKGWRTVLVPRRAQDPAIVVETSLGVTIDSLAVITSTPSKPGAVPTGIAIGLRNTIGTAIERCVLAQLTTLRGSVEQPDDTTTTESGTTDANAFVAAFGPRAAGAPLIALDGIVAETLIHENVLAGTVGIGPLFADPRSALGDQRSMYVGTIDREVSSTAEIPFASRGYLISLDLAVEDNVFICSLGGVALEGLTMQLGETRIGHNSVLGCLRAGITSLGMLGPFGRIDVVENLVRVLGTGIAVGTDDTRVADNDVGSLLTARAQVASTAGFTNAAIVNFSLGAGIVLAPSLRPASMDRCIVTGNRVVRMLGDGIAIRAQVVSATIAHNILQAIGGSGIAMEGTTAELLTVESNKVLGVAVLPVPENRIAAGILLVSTQNAAVVGNTVAGVAAVRADSEVRRGIAVRGSGTARVTGNHVSGVAPEGEFLGLAAGIAIESGFQQADVTNNVVRRSGGESDDQSSAWIGLMVAGGAAVPAGTKPVINVLQVLVADEGLFLFGSSHGKLVHLPRGKGTAGVHGNLVEAYGRAPAVLVETAGSCIFSDNRCFVIAPPEQAVANVTAGALVANANYLEGSEKGPSFVIHLPSAGAFTVLGNVASGPILVGTAALPAPWDQLNMF
jgi:Family of unknown function (DUF6519)/Right handed beta helix region